MEDTTTSVIAIIIAAILNIVLNFIAIPLFKQDGAALTTVIAEFVVCIVSLFYVRGLCKFGNLKKTVFISLVSCIAICLVSFIVKFFIENILIQTILICFLGVLVYGVISILLKNEIILDILKELKSKFKKKVEIV